MIDLMEDSRRGRGILGWLWSLVRFPALLVLVILEPVVAFACSTLALLGVLTTLFFALLHVPHFPAGSMLALSIGFALVLVLYEGLIRVLSD